MTTKQIWTRRVLSGLAVLFLLFDAVGKLVRPQAVIDGTTQLGYSADVILPLGIIQLVCLILYLIPRTSVLGALLWLGLWLRETRLRALLPLRAAH